MAKKKSSKSKVASKLRVMHSGAGKLKERKENPFESIWSRRKFNILGQKRKSGETERRRVGLSRSLAIQKRQKTLLKEYVQSSKSSVFLDKRIGENDEGLEEFDKTILRSQREIQSKLKKESKYNLSDGEEDDLDIGEGAYFSERDDYEDEDPQDDEEEAFTLSRLNPNEVADGMDSRLEPQETRHKTKKEVMDDIISKSKYFKAQKAKEKEEHEQFMEQLDKDFTSLVQSDALSTLNQPGKSKVVVSNIISNVNPRKIEEKPDHYDKLVSELALDIRARPSDRTKTAEELAQAEKERLEQLEEERQKRMATTEDSSDEAASTSDDYDHESGKILNLVSGDDLGNSFSDDAVSRNKGIWIDDILRRENSNNLSENPSSSGNVENDDEEEEDDDDNEDEDTDLDDERELDASDGDSDEAKNIQSLKDWEQSDDENIESDLDEKDETASDDDCKLVGVKKQEKRARKGEKLKISGDSDKVNEKVKMNVLKDSDRQGDIPYTIEAPKNFEEFNMLLENRSDEQIAEVIKRIRTYNAITIAAENRKKIQVFYGILLQYFAVLASKKPLKFTLLNMLVKPLMEISAEVPYFAAICARQRLLRTRTLFCEDLKNIDKTSWPSLKTICLLRLWCMIFPCSDFHHAVMTPSILLISEYLMRCRVISGRDIATGSFLCSLVLSVSKHSKRYCPEAITFIQTMLMGAISNKQIIESSQLYHLMELKSLGPLIRFKRHVKEICPLEFLVLMDLPDDSSYFSSDVFKASLLSALLGNLKGYIDIYQDLKSFPEIFSPFSKVLYGLAEEDQIPEMLKPDIREMASRIENKCKEFHAVRRPLRYQKVKIVKTFAPKFEENFIKGRDYDPDGERAERKKLKKRLKQEARGAARELRKDNQFLLDVKEKERAQFYEEKAERYGKHKAFLQEQEHAFKSGQLGKGRKRRR